MISYGELMTVGFVNILVSSELMTVGFVNRSGELMTVVFVNRLDSFLSMLQQKYGLKLQGKLNPIGANKGIYGNDFAFNLNGKLPL